MKLYTVSENICLQGGAGLGLVKVDFFRVLAHCEWGAGESGNNDHKWAAEDTSWILWGFQCWRRIDTNMILTLHNDKISSVLGLPDNFPKLHSSETLQFILLWFCHCDCSSYGHSVAFQNLCAENVHRCKTIINS